MNLHPPHTALRPWNEDRRFPRPLNGKSQSSHANVLDFVARARRQSPDGSALHPTTPTTEHDKLVDQSRKLVAQTFFGALLKQMRQSPFRSKLFEGGRGGEAFGAMYDQKLAEHMAPAAGGKLVHAIVHKIESRRHPASANARAAAARGARAAYARQSLKRSSSTAPEHDAPGASHQSPSASREAPAGSHQAPGASHEARGLIPFGRGGPRPDFFRTMRDHVAPGL